MAHPPQNQLGECDCHQDRLEHFRPPYRTSHSALLQKETKITVMSSSQHSNPRMSDMRFEASRSQQTKLKSCQAMSVEPDSWKLVTDAANVAKIRRAGGRNIKPCLVDIN